MNANNSNHWQISNYRKIEKDSSEEYTWTDNLLVILFTIFLVFLGVIAG